MPRIARIAPGGIVYHVLNLGNNRQTIFHKDASARNPYPIPCAMLNVSAPRQQRDEGGG
jgi:hypothetical protein